MNIGVNLPWFDYGWDFGDAPPGWRNGSDPTWAGSINANLDYFYDLGIRVIRWFIFGDGLTYGTGENAPQKNQKEEWDFEPSDLSDSFSRHFRQLLESFTKFNKNKKGQPPIQLLPVLLDFHLCMKGSIAARTNALKWIKTGQTDNWIKGGRIKMVTDSRMSKKFYDSALEPLLKIAEDHRETIFAWDIFNEPDWITEGWHPSKHIRGLPVKAVSMQQFLVLAMERVHAKKFKTTIGFALIKTIESSKLSSEKLPPPLNKSLHYDQFHHYNLDDDKKILPKNAFKEKGIVGEFASSFNKDFWPELKENQDVIYRLKQIEKMQYPLALIWSGLGNDDHTSWGDAEQGIKKFLNKG